MAKHSLEIDGNFKSLLAGFESIKKAAASLGGKKYGINIDDKALKSVDKQIKSIYKSIEHQSEHISKRINLLGKLLSKATDPKAVKEYSREISTLGTQLNKIVNSMGGSAGAPTASKGKGGLAGLISSFGAAGGGGINGLMGMVARAGIAGASVFAAYEVGKMLVSPAFREAGPRMTLRGLGASSSQISAAQYGGRAYGYGPEESLQQAIALRRATGSESQLGGVQAFGRMTGFGPEALTGQMGQLRQAGMQGPESLKFLKDTYREAISKGFDESRALDVMQAISEHTGSMAQTGGVSAGAIKSIVMGLMGSSSFFTQNAGRAMAALGGAEGAFKGGGPGSALAFRALKEIYPNESPIGIMHKIGYGFTENAQGPDIYKAYMKQWATTAGATGAGFGKGMGQFAGGEKGNSFQALAIMIREKFGGSQTLADEIAKAWAMGEDKALKEKVSKTDVLNSPEMNLVKIASEAEAIHSLIAQDIAPALRPLSWVITKIADRLGLAKEQEETIGEKQWLRHAGKTRMASGSPIGIAWGAMNYAQSLWAPDNPKTYTPKVSPEEVYKNLRAKGYSHEQAVGKLTNILGESGFNPGAIGDGGQSIGLTQRSRGRAKALVKHSGGNWSDWKEQLNFDMTETEEKEYLEKTKGMSSEQASKWYTEHVEKPKYTQMKAVQRASYTKQFENLKTTDSNGVRPDLVSAVYDAISSAFHKVLARTPEHPSKVTDISGYKTNKSGH